MTEYGVSELNHTVFCPRCLEEVPVYLIKIFDRFKTKVEIHCLKCRHHGHKNGTYIDELQKGA
jgi:hypothetical protein